MFVPGFIYIVHQNIVKTVIAQTMLRLDGYAVVCIVGSARVIPIECAMQCPTILLIECCHMK